MLEQARTPLYQLGKLSIYSLDKNQPASRNEITNWFKKRMDFQMLSLKKPRYEVAFPQEVYRNTMLVGAGNLFWTISFLSLKKI